MNGQHNIIINIYNIIVALARTWVAIIIILLLLVIIIIMIFIRQCVGAHRIIQRAEQLLVPRRVGTYLVLGSRTSVAVCRVARTFVSLRRPV